ncbi:MAG: aspartate/glutamate racemase family protein [Roseobacter sp.]
MIVLINPNATVSMTQSMLSTARATAPGLNIVGWTSHAGPPAIQGVEDGEAATAPLLQLVEKAANQGATCIIIGCFDDTALAQARALVRCPVIGIGQAAYFVAAAAGARFSVVTTLEVSVPILEANIKAYGLSSSLGQVRASGVPVLALESSPEAASQQIAATIQTAVQEDKVNHIVLGCGGMVDVNTHMANPQNLRLIDGVRAAAHLAAALN